MKVGTICYATEQGLGILAKSFYDHGVITHACVLKHRVNPTHMEWYPGAPMLEFYPFDGRLIKDFVTSVDVMLFFETPFAWELIDYAKARGVRTVLMPMYECMPEKLPTIPHKIICPSLLDLDYYPNGEHIPVPCDVPWRLRERAEVFVHNGGHLGLQGRNGTLELLQAMRYVRSPIKMIVRAQDAQFPRLLRRVPAATRDRRIRIQQYSVPFNELFNGDVCIRPEKFNGLSLPLQESACAGMLCMTTERYPMNKWLPPDPLIPVRGTHRRPIIPGGHAVEQSIIDPRDIAAKIDEWYGRDIREYSLIGKQIAETLSWERLKPRYMKALAA